MWICHLLDEEEEEEEDEEAAAEVHRRQQLGTNGWGSNDWSARHFRMTVVVCDALGTIRYVVEPPTDLASTTDLVECN